VTGMWDHQIVPLYNVFKVASLQTFDACVVQVTVIIAEQSNRLF